MTTTDYDDRLARLKAAKAGDTVTVPDNWERPDAHEVSLDVSDLRSALEPGVVFTHDGGDDALPWRNEDLGYNFTTDLAQLGLDVDQADEPAGETAGEYVRIGEVSTDGDAGDPDDDDDDDRVSVGTVHVRVIPDTDGFVEKITKVAGEAADAIDAAGFHLDEYQRERVAALEQAVRVLESRRAPQDGKGAGIFAALTSPGTSVPMVGVQDMVYVAAFIAMGETDTVGKAKA